MEISALIGFLSSKAHWHLIGVLHKWCNHGSGSSVLMTAAIIPFAVDFSLIGLELGVAGLQSYVFTILVCIYLNDAIALH